MAFLAIPSNHLFVFYLSSLKISEELFKEPKTTIHSYQFYLHYVLWVFFLWQSFMSTRYMFPTHSFQTFMPLRPFPEGRVIRIHLGMSGSLLSFSFSTTIKLLSASQYYYQQLLSSFYFDRYIKLKCSFPRKKFIKFLVKLLWMITIWEFLVYFFWNVARSSSDYVSYTL
jgi:hypothetical protein